MRDPRFDRPLTDVYAAGHEDELDFLDIFRIINRHRYIILGSTVTITVLIAVIVFQLAPRYTAKALIKVDSGQLNIVDIESVVSSSYSDQMNIDSEVEIMRSPSLAKKVIAKTGLAGYDEFSPRKRPGALTSLLSAILPDSLVEPTADAVTGATEDDESAFSPRELSKVVEMFAGRLNVAPVRRTRIIMVAFTSENPTLAATVANATANLYILQQLETKFAATKQASEWLSGRIEKMQKKVEDSERAVVEYQSRQGIFEMGGITIDAQQLSEVNSQLIIARSHRAGANAKLQQLERLMASGKQDGLESVSEVLSSRLIQDLSIQESMILRKISELSTEFGERHPVMINARAELREVNLKKTLEIRNIAIGLKNDVEVARARERSLANDLERLKKGATREKEATIKLKSLKREAAANRILFETFLSRFKETSEQKDLDQADATIVALADPPINPSYPKKRLLIGGGFIFSLIAGLGLAFLIERIDSGFRSADQIEQMTNIPAIGIVPSIISRTGNALLPEDSILKNPNSSYAEAVRSVRTSLLLSDIDNPPSVFLVTSSLPQEGKTSLCLSLARQSAKAGQSVLLIDCDIRRPSIHKILGKHKNSIGLTEVLSKKRKFSEAVLYDSSGAHVLPTGKHVTHPEQLLNSKAMRSFIKSVKAEYDLVIIDSSPVLAVSDARLIAPLVDRSVFLVRWESTKRDVALAGLKTLVDTGTIMAGVVLTRVDVVKNSYYGYSDSGRYYHTKYSRYYTDAEV